MTYNYLIHHYDTIEKPIRKDVIKSLIENLHFNEQNSQRLIELLLLELNHTLKT